MKIATSHIHNNWSEPEQAVTTPANVSYIFTCVCRTLVPEICVHPKMLHVFQYIDVLTCMIYN